MDQMGSAATYRRLWESGTYDQSGSTSSSDASTPPSDGSTPLLISLIDALQQLRNGNRSIPRVFEGGAGSGHHALLLAEAGFLVTANEYDIRATKQMERLKERLGDPSFLEIVVGDVADGVRAQEQGSLSAFYANSLLHTFSVEERSNLYKDIRRVQVPRGLIAVSFKAAGDALQHEGTLVRETEAGQIVSDQYGIQRLFVAHLEPLTKELEAVGYRVIGTATWALAEYIAVKNYGPGERKFIGVLAQRE